jgi:hypothetical protein
MTIWLQAETRRIYEEIQEFMKDVDTGNDKKNGTDKKKVIDIFDPDAPIYD